MKGILFSQPMVKAIDEGHKTMTRRVITPDMCAGKKKVAPNNCTVGFGQSAHPNYWIEQWPIDLTFIQPESKPTTMNGNSYRSRYQVGEILYVRETWYAEKRYNYLKPSKIPINSLIGYTARDIKPDWSGKLRTAMFLPEKYARTHIEITAIRAERLQDITPLDALREGVAGSPPPAGDWRDLFRILWDSINAKSYPWASNPWVWVYEFKKVTL